MNDFKTFVTHGGPESAPESAATSSREIQGFIAVLDDVESPQALRYGLRVFLPYLSAQFHAEERPGGLHEELVTRLPGRDRRVAQLRREHGEILAEVRALASSLETKHSDPQTLRERTRRLAGRVRAHERTERKLLADSHFQDTGTGD